MNKIINDRNTYILIVLFLSILLIVKHYIIFISFNIGFDLIDEGSHLLFYNYPEEYPITFHNYQYFVSLLPKQFLKISNLRLLGWLVEFVGTVGLTLGIWVYFKPHLPQKQKLFTVFFLFCLSSVGLSMHDRMLGYNIINMSLTYLSFGACLFALKDDKNGKKDLAAFFLIGTVMSVVLFIKMTTFILIFPILIITYIHQKRNFISSVLALLFGVFVGIIVSWAIVSSSNPNWISDFKLGFNLGRISGYGNTQLLISKFLIPVISLIIKLAISILIPIGIAKLIKVKIYNEKGKLNLFLLYISSLFFLIAIVTLTSAQDYYIELHNIANNQIYAAPILILHLFFYLFAIDRFVFIRKWHFKSNEKIIAVFVGLLCIAPANFFGSFSNILESLYAYTLPILAISFIFSILSEPDKSNLTLNKFTVVVLSIFCFILFIQVKWIYPSRLLEPMKYQTEKIDIKENIKLDKLTAEYILALKTKLEELPKSKNTCYIGNYAGTVYLLDKIQIGTTLYLSFAFPGDMDEMNASFNRFFYQEYKEEMKNSILLISSGITPSNLYSEFEDGILDGQNHIKVDSVFNPYLKREMIVNQRIQSPYTYIYIPNKSQNN